MCPCFLSQNWPPPSWDLTPINFFLGAVLKSRVHPNKPTTTQTLRAEIEHYINEITPYLCKVVIKNFDRRANVYFQSFYSHLLNMLINAWVPNTHVIVVYNKYFSNLPQSYYIPFTNSFLIFNWNYFWHF